MKELRVRVCIPQNNFEERNLQEKIRIAIYGKKLFGVSEWEKMSLKDKNIIVHINKRAQVVINRMKHERVEELTAQALKAMNLFNSRAGKGLMHAFPFEGNLPFCTMQLKDLGITKEMITSRLIKEGIIHE